MGTNKQKNEFVVSLRAAVLIVVSFKMYVGRCYIEWSKSAWPEYEAVYVEAVGAAVQGQLQNGHGGRVVAQGEQRVAHCGQQHRRPPAQSQLTHRRVRVVKRIYTQIHHSFIHSFIHYKYHGMYTHEKNKGGKTVLN